MTEYFSIIPKFSKSQLSPDAQSIGGHNVCIMWEV